jgi:hypothetical protein
MVMRLRTLAATLVVLLITPLWANTAGAQTPNTRACIYGLNLAGGKIASTAEAEARYCAALDQKSALPPGMSTQACLSADLRGRLAAADARAAKVDATRCTPAPSFGYAGGTAVAAAGRQEGLDLIADIFGPDFTAAIVPVKCQTRLIDSLGRLTDAQRREFFACKKAGLASGAITDADGLAACLAAIDVDAHGKVGKALARLASDDARYCDGFTRADLFKGYCTFASDFLACVDVRARCRVCEALNRMDDLAMDCELFDDGLANGSCGPCLPDPDGLCCNASDRDACGFCGGTGFRCG